MAKIHLAALSLLLFISCSKNKDKVTPSSIDYRQEMRNFVIGISTYSKSIKSNFQVIPQNGIELVGSDGKENGQPDINYLNAIDGNGQEDLLYGYPNDDQPTPTNSTNYLKTYLVISKNIGKKILVIDYCSTHSKMNDAYNQNKINGFVSFSADHRQLDNIPVYPNPIYAENNKPITSLSQIQNFLYLINPEKFSTKADFINAIKATNYDLLVMDLYFHDGNPFTNSEINQLKNKANGGTRLVIAYMSIGEAEEYRYYWQTNWNNNKPSWLDAENPDWKGNFKVKYWNKEWQEVIYGNNNSYLKKIINANFDGVYLDIIDAFEYYE